jgi:hypothetical protein
MFTFLFATSALALDCSADPTFCPTVDAMVTSLNAQLGAPVVTDSAPRRIRPQTLFDKLLPLRDTLEAQECTVTGWTAGLYGETAGSWDGDYVDTETGSWSGTYANKAFGGTYTTTIGTGAAGDVFALYHHGQVAGNLDADGVIAGIWARRAGRRGIHAELHATCDAPLDAIRGWYKGPIETVVSTSEIVTFRYTGDDSSRLYVDGVQIAASPSSAAIDWSTVSTNELELESGEHTVALYVNDVGGSAVMMQFEATDASGATLLSTDDVSSWRTLASVPFTDWNTPSFDDSSWATPLRCGSPIMSPWNGFAGTGTDYVWPSPGCTGAFPTHALFRGTLVID